MKTLKVENILHDTFKYFIFLEYGNGFSGFEPDLLRYLVFS